MCCSCLSQALDEATCTSSAARWNRSSETAVRSATQLRTQPLLGSCLVFLSIVRILFAHGVDPVPLFGLLDTVTCGCFGIAGDVNSFLPPEPCERMCNRGLILLATPILCLPLIACSPCLLYGLGYLAHDEWKHKKAEAERKPAVPHVEPPKNQEMPSV